MSGGGDLGLPGVFPPALGDFDVWFLGSNTYLLSLRETAKFYTGATITEYLNLPVSHRLLKIELKHTDNVNVDSVDSWSYQLRRIGIQNLYNTLRAAAAVTVSDVLETFDDSFVSNTTIYRLYCTQTTGTDRIYPIFYIKAL